MNPYNIDLLIQKYYSGDTTLEEERLLLHFFKHEAVPPHLEKEKELFLALHSKEPIDVPHDLGSRLETMIDLLDEEEKTERVALRRRKINFTTWASVAAAIVVAISISLYKTNDKAPEAIAMQNEIESPEKLYEQTRQVLALVSTKLNAGIDKVQQSKAELEKANKVLNQQFELDKQQK